MENNQVGFFLDKINTVQFATIEMEIEDRAEIAIQANIDFGFHQENKKVMCITKFEFQYTHKPFMVLEVNCEFQISDSKWAEMISKSEIVLPKGMLQHLAVITIGTVRGVLHAKTENTDYNKYYLPTMNVSKMIEEDISFTLEE